MSTAVRTPRPVAALVVVAMDEEARPFLDALSPFDDVDEVLLLGAARARNLALPGAAAARGGALAVDGGAPAAIGADAGPGGDSIGGSPADRPALGAGRRPAGPGGLGPPGVCRLWVLGLWCRGRVLLCCACACGFLGGLLWPSGGLWCVGVVWLGVLPGSSLLVGGGWGGGCAVGFWGGAPWCGLCGVLLVVCWWVLRWVGWL